MAGVDWIGEGLDRTDAARRLYEAGVPVSAIAITLGIGETTVTRNAKAGGWTAPEVMKSLYDKATEKILATREARARDETALMLTDDEADKLVEDLGSRDVTLPERAAQYTALMSRVAMRVAVLHLRSTDQSLLANSDKLAQLDKIARRALQIDAPVTGPVKSGGTVVNVMSSMTAGLPPALTGEAAARLERECLTFADVALPPVIEGAFQKK